MKHTQTTMGAYVVDAACSGVACFMFVAAQHRPLPEDSFIFFWLNLRITVSGILLQASHEM